MTKLSAALLFFYLCSPAGAEVNVLVRVDTVKGEVKIYPAGSPVLETLRPGAELQKGDTLLTPEEGYVKLVYTSGHIIQLAGNTIFTIEESGREYISKLLAGRAKFIVKKLKRKDKFRIITPAATLLVRGTEFVAKVEEGGRTDTYLLRGRLKVKDDTYHSLTLEPGCICIARKDIACEMRQATEEEIESFCRGWSDDTDE